MNELVEDLKAFLASPPAGLVRALRLPLTRRPTSAWAEPTAHARWQLEALVQDVWEHTVGPESRVQEQIVASLSSIARGSVYDFGAGAGYYAMKLAERGATVMCVERSRVKRTFLRFRIARHGMEERVFMRRFTRRFDAALAINVLDHLRRPDGAIRGLAARVRKGGKLIAWAAFPEDGWHTSGTEVRRKVRRALLRYFEPQATAPKAPRELIVLNRRRVKPGNIWLDPELTVRPHPRRSGRVVVFAPRAYADALVASDDIGRLIGLCRGNDSLSEVRRLSEREGFEWNSTRRAIWKICKAGLGVVRPKHLLEVAA